MLTMRSIAAFTCGAALSLGLTLSLRPPLAAPKSYSPYRKLDIFAQVLTQVETHYVEPVDDTRLIYGAIQGMMQSLDPHSVFMPPDIYAQLKAETQGEFGGIGIEVEIRDGWLTVVAPLQGTPAEVAGLKSGDQIREIDGKSTQGLNMMDAIKAMRGARGTVVRLTVQRAGTSGLLQFKVVRDIIKIESVTHSVPRPGIGLIRLRAFQDGTDQALEAALQSLKKGGNLKGLVLDLRDNPGGLLDQAIRVADFFLDKGLIVRTKGKGGQVQDEAIAHERGTFLGFPMVCLVNGGSASASEILAGALQDQRRAVILGSQTFGKGSVQTIMDLEDGSGLKLTVARYYTPSGRAIQERGIQPDVLVPETAPPSKQAQGPREKDLQGHLPREDSRSTASPSEPRLADFQLQTALDYLRAAEIFQGKAS